MINILLIDDEIMIVNALTRLLRRSFRDEVHIEGSSRPHDALVCVQETTFDVVVSDYRMPEMNGIELLNKIAFFQPDTACLMVSATEDFSELEQAVKESLIVNFIPKPWEDACFLDAVVQAAALSRKKRGQ